MTIADTDLYTFALPAALEADTDVTVKTIADGKQRAILFGIKAE
jgi:hypothetical protein